MTSIAQAIDCPKCGAALTASAGSTTCPFCGTVSTIHPEAAAAKEEVAPHMVSLVSPLWLVAWAKPASWLWPRDEANIVVLPFADPYDKADRLPCLHLALADRLAAETHVLVQSMVATTGGRVVTVFNEPLGTHAGIAHWAQKFTPSPIAVLWGELGPDDSSDVLLRARAPAYGDPAVELEVSVPLAAAADTFLDWLVTQGRAQRVAPASWYGRPQDSLVEGYQTAIRGMLYFVLAKNNLLPSLEATWCPQYIEWAFNLAINPQAPPQCRLFPLTLTILAAQMGVLDAGHRKRALDVARAATAPGDLLTWMSPHLLRQLGAVSEADARAKSLSAQPDLSVPYKTWLDSLARPA